MRKPNLYLQEIPDRYTRENFKRLSDKLFEDNILLSDFKHFEFNFEAAVTDLDILHHLGYVPLDVITTWVTPGITLDWKYDEFTASTLRLTTSGACRVRAFIGAYKKGRLL